MKKEDLTDQIISDAAARFGLIPVQRGAEAERFVLPEEQGVGSCTFFRVDENLALMRSEFSFARSMVIRLSGLACGYLAYLQSVQAEWSRNGTVVPLSPETLYTNLGSLHGGEVTFAAGSTLRADVVLADSGCRGFGSLGGSEAAVRSAFRGVDALRGISGVQTVLDQMDRCPIRNNPNLTRLYYKGKLQELVALYLHAARAVPGADSGRKLEQEERERVEMLLAFLRENLHDDVDMPTLAKMGNMSVSKLKYTFKAATGMSFRDYRNKMKIHRAQELLAETDLPLWKISAQLGFSNPSGFSRFFRERLKTSPYAYRSWFRQRSERIPAGGETAS